MNESSPHDVTMLLPRQAERGTTSSYGTAAIPHDVLSQSASRLRVLALLYAFTFFMANFVPNLLFTHMREPFFRSPANWVPGVLSIAMALVVWAVASSSRVPLHTVMKIALVFEVISCYGIAFAEYLEPSRLDMGGFIGLSWVAVWAPLFTLIVPARPLNAALVTLAAVSAPPVVIGWMIASGQTAFRPEPHFFFFWIVFPYVLVTILAYVGARVVHGLRKAVTAARELGSYQLTERLGQGGMGEVWVAKHRLLARPAAIKLIRPSAAGTPAGMDDAIRRFEHEAQVTAGLSSPHTVQLFDFGVADDGSFYYVMELLKGLDMERLVRRHGPVPAERAIYFLRQVCHSLAEAQACGLVHRDIKPANLFVCRYGGEYDFVKVLDFGIAKAARHSLETGALALTRDNVLQGTPAYISPEQALGDSAVDGRADIYATGCVAYFLLTGELVFSGDTPVALAVHHAHTTPIAPSQRSELPIPAALDRLILDCLAKNPADRPQSARELARRLDQITGLEPWTQDRAEAWWKMHGADT